MNYRIASDVELLDATEAVSELAELCFNSNAEDIAKIEKTLFRLGLPLLAAVAHREGVNNCGDEYLEIYDNTTTR